jgi:uncharacterized protein YdaU (DUF1376 family)
MSHAIDRFFPFYGADFFESEKVACMSLAARGLYIGALWRQWRTGGLPADPQLLARLLGVGLDEFRQVWPEVAPCFELVDGRLQNRRLELVRAEQQATLEKRQSAGKKGGEARAAKQRSSIATATLEQCSSNAQANSKQDRREEKRIGDKNNLPPTPSAEGEKPAKRKRAGEPWQTILERPELIRLRMSPAFSTAWAEWIEHCQTAGSKAKEPSGPRAVAMLNEAAQNPERYAEALRQAIRSNWQAPHVEALQRRQQAAEPRNASQRNLDVIRNSARQLGLLTEHLS